MKSARTTYTTRQADGCVLLDSRRGVVFTLNSVGAILWERIRDGASREDLMTLLTRRYPEVSADRLVGDLNLFVNTLIEKCLIEP